MVISSSYQTFVARVHQRFHTSSDCFEGVIDGFPIIVVISIVSVNNISLSGVCGQHGRKAQQNHDVVRHVETVRCGVCANLK